MCKKNRRNFGEQQSKHIFNLMASKNLNNEGYLPKNKNVIENYKFLFKNHAKKGAIS